MAMIDHAAHCRCAGLAHLSLESEVAHNFAHLHHLQTVDDVPTHDCGDED